jgi:peptidoglycan hydrolase-like protein with peptidoglycan-binding domain
MVRALWPALSGLVVLITGAAAAHTVDGARAYPVSDRVRSPVVMAAADAAVTPSAPHTDSVVESIQRDLNRLGYDAGPVDGRLGNRTARAIRRYQRVHSLPVDGRATPELADHVQSRGRPDPGRP